MMYVVNYALIQSLNSILKVRMLTLSLMNSMLDILFIMVFLNLIDYVMIPLKNHLKYTALMDSKNMTKSYLSSKSLVTAIWLMIELFTNENVINVVYLVSLVYPQIMSVTLMQHPFIKLKYVKTMLSCLEVLDVNTLETGSSLILKLYLVVKVKHIWYMLWVGTIMLTKNIITHMVKMLSLTLWTGLMNTDKIELIWLIMGADLISISYKKLSLIKVLKPDPFDLMVAY